MSWEQLLAFIDMGGHAAYVWGAYAIAAMGLVWEGVVLWMRRRQAVDEQPMSDDDASAPSCTARR